MKIDQPKFTAAGQFAYGPQADIALRHEAQLRIAQHRLDEGSFELLARIEDTKAAGETVEAVGRLLPRAGGGIDRRTEEYGAMGRLMDSEERCALRHLDDRQGPRSE